MRKGLIIGVVLCGAAGHAWAQETTLEDNTQEAEAPARREVNIDGLISIGTSQEAERFKEWHERYLEALKNGKTIEPFQRRTNSWEEFDRLADEALQQRKREVARRNKQREKWLKRNAGRMDQMGHKRPPKMRPPGKQRFCKECGMVH